MKKLLLPYLFISLTILLIIVQQVNAQTKGPLTCQDLEKILDSKECPRWVIESDKLWCAQRTEELMYLPKEGDIVKLFRNRPPDYTLLPNDWPCPDKESTQPEQQPAPTSEESQSPTVQPPTKEEEVPVETEAPIEKPQEVNLFKKVLGGFPVFIGEWLDKISFGIAAQEFFAGTQQLADLLLKAHDRMEMYDILSELTDEQIKEYTGQTRREIVERQPNITKAHVADWKADWVRKEELAKSPFTADIVQGQVQIKLPGQQRWVDLKQGDKILPGSTIFTGMDATTILSIRDKGMMEVLPFTEITVSERGLEQAGSEGKTSTEVYLRKGEVEVNVDPSNLSPASGVPGWGMSVYGYYYAAAVRGTHFWVRQDLEKDFAVIGVYEGQVEVTISGSDQPTLLSPVGDPSSDSGQVKPAILAITSRLSPGKLVLVGLVLVAVVGGAIMILRRKFVPKGSAKKKK